MPPKDKYFSLGFRSKIRDTKHYRYYIEKEMENSDFMGNEIFTTIDMH